jgi:hypothetical protein
MAIATLDGGGRVAGRTVGWRVAIDRGMVQAGARDGVNFFRRLSS